MKLAALTALLLVFTQAAPGEPAATPPYGLDRPALMTGYLGGRMPEVGPGVSGNWKTVVAFPRLTFKNPLGLCPQPGTSRLVVWEREGRVWSFENREDTAEKKLILDLSNQCQGWDDSGLLGLAFHPQFEKNRFVFVSYTWVRPGTVTGNPNERPPVDKPNRDRLARFTLDANGVAVPGSELILMDQDAHTVWHNGGGLFFHPGNGLLYLTNGDDEHEDAQVIDRGLFGGIFRLDVDQKGGNFSHPIPRQPEHGRTANYFIPNDNPFVGRPGALEEFYALGLRSPHRMTHDAPSGRTFIGDVGGGEREEIDVIEPNDHAGLNFQWPRIEGLKGDLTGTFVGRSKKPVLDYDHGEGNAVIGGYVYRGKKWAEDLGGSYIFGDNGTGKIWALNERVSPAAKILLATLPNGPGPNSGSSYVGLSSFGLDRDGELYLCQLSSEAGRIHRLERTGEPPKRKPFPSLLSQTGAFTDTARLTAAPGLVPYTVNSPLWSDGAAKLRWMALPAGTKVRFNDKGEKAFPPGTVFVKHFEIALDERHPETRRRLETRLLVMDANGAAYGVTYKWRADNSDADLLPAGLDEELSLREAGGATRRQTWSYPSQTDCTRCHTAPAGFVLGPKVSQLNGAFDYPDKRLKDNQLRAWNHAGLLEPALDEATLPTLPRLVSLTDTTAPLEQRVRSYLDANCSQCHRPGGVHARWDARSEIPLAEAGIVNARALLSLGRPGAKIVKPGDTAHSVLFQRLGSTDPAVQMPPLARHRPDTAAVEVVRQWINTLPPAPDALPQPWTSEDIGGVSQSGPGDALFANGTFTVQGGGDDVWGTEDSFHYVFQPLRGDGQITARVASVGNTDGWAKAGVMIRDGNAANAAHAFTLITPGAGAELQFRPESGGGSSERNNFPATAPQWVRLDRKGDTLSSFLSADGRSWTKAGEASIRMKPDVLIGLAVTAHNGGALCPATFDHVAVQGGK